MREASELSIACDRYVQDLLITHLATINLDMP